MADNLRRVVVYTQDTEAPADLSVGERVELGPIYWALPGDAVSEARKISCSCRRT